MKISRKFYPTESRIFGVTYGYESAKDFINSLNKEDIVNIIENDYGDVIVWYWSN